MLLLVPVHAAVMLSINGYPGNWSVAAFWLVHIFRLPLFFAMSGFFLVFLISRKGIERTLRNRTMRIAVPLAVGLVTVVPLFFWICEATDIVALGENGHSGSGDGFGIRLSYLWFLWYLLVIDAIAFLAYLAAPRALASASRVLGRVLSRPALGLVVFAVPTILLLLAQPNWAGLPASGRIVPEAEPLAYNAVFFVLGAVLSANRGVIANLRRNCWRWGAFAVVAVAVAGAFFALHNSSVADRVYVHYPINITNAVATFACLFALIGLANHYLDKSRPKLRYLADSSYWIYLAHMPIVALLVALVVDAGSIGTAPAFLFVTVATIAVTLAAYPVFVRYTPIGWILNGKRRRTRPGLWQRLRPGREPVSQPAEAAEPRA